VTRWFEPFIDYGADSNRKTPFYDATIALGYRVRELLSRRDAKEPEVSQRADSVSGFISASHAYASYDKDPSPFSY
jgi:hypothetical protein